MFFSGRERSIFFPEVCRWRQRPLMDNASADNTVQRVNTMNHEMFWTKEITSLYVLYGSSWLAPVWSSPSMCWFSCCYTVAVSQSVVCEWSSFKLFKKNKRIVRLKSCVAFLFDASPCFTSVFTGFVELLALMYVSYMSMFIDWGIVILFLFPLTFIGCLMNNKIHT